ncbi:MAG: SGNH/GDSL hydrolase family protein [Armatimonadia bacterium]
MSEMIGFLGLLGLLAIVAGLLCLTPRSADAQEPALTWIDARDLTIEGKGWADTAGFYDRLPAKAKGVVRPPVWDLSLDSSGYCVRLRTDAPTLHVKWELRKPNLAMDHMPATGVSGVDLYAREASGWRFIATGRVTKQANEATFSTAGRSEFALYLPLYNGVNSVSLGVPEGKFIGKIDESSRGKPIVFYGTSITQGGCASRPGMAYPAIVGRALDLPIINLGFSGNGQSEPEMADLLAELDPSVYVLDALWNMTAEMVQERLAPCVRKLRAAHPQTPILLAEDCTIRNQIPTPKGKLLREIFDQLKQEGVTGLYFLSAEGMMGPDDQGTVDGCHPTDLGFIYQAEVFTKALRPLVGK